MLKLIKIMALVGMMSAFAVSSAVAGDANILAQLANDGIVAQQLDDTAMSQIRGEGVHKQGHFTYYVVVSNTGMAAMGYYTGYRHNSTGYTPTPTATTYNGVDCYKHTERYAVSQGMSSPKYLETMTLWTTDPSDLNTNIRSTRSSSWNRPESVIRW